jgi:hypothetical protein
VAWGGRIQENPVTLKITLRRILALCLIVFSGVLTANSLAQQTTPQTQPSTTDAQQPASQPSQTSTQAQPADPSKPPVTQPQNKATTDENLKKQQETGTSNDRLFYALPNFLTVETKNVPPLTVGQKFKVVARGSFDYIQIPWYAALAGISQAENSEPGYGQGASGYGKRYAAYFADGTIENFFTGAILPSVLRQDPRFYQSGKGGFFHRSGYAISRIFVTRTDAGGSQFNYSEIAGAAGAAFISTYSYHPRGDRNVPNTLSVWGTQVGYDTVTYVVKEFWPDIRRKLSKKKQPDAIQMVSPGVVSDH